MSFGSLLGGRYELRATLGRGGFGTVWRAYDRTLGREVAVKIIKFDQFGSLSGVDLRRRFVREAQAVAALNHPNVVTAHDFGVDDDSAFLVMEMISGSSLEGELVDRRQREIGSFDVPTVIAIGAQICAGLSAAHAAGLVHRDLKPANVMRTAGGQVKIVDFGIARDADQSRLTQTGVYLGTLRYTSPEQMNGDPIDGRSDLYSLGCVLFELLTDTSPYDAQNPAQWVAAHQSGRPKLLSALLPSVPADLDALMSELLAKKPEQRPATADVVRARLERVRVGGRPGGTSGSGAQQRPLDLPRPTPGPRTGPRQAAPAGQFARPLPPAGWPVPQQARPHPPYQQQYAGAYPSPGGYPLPNPYAGYPYGLPPERPMPRPLTVTIATILLLISAVLSACIGFATIAGRVAIESAWHRAFDKLVAPSGRSGLGTGFGITAGAVCAQVVLAVVLAYPVYRGGRQARIITWLYVGVTSLCCLGIGAMPYLFTPTSADTAAGQAAKLSQASAQFTAEYPGWLKGWSISLGVAGALALIGAAVLLATPPSNRFFRFARAGVRLPPPMR